MKADLAIPDSKTSPTTLVLLKRSCEDLGSKMRFHLSVVSFDYTGEYVALAS